MMQSLLYQPNEKVLLEIDAIEKSRDSLEAKLHETKTLEAYISSFLHSCGGIEFLEKIPKQRKMKVLDIGFGRGETSLYLAAAGHEVHAIEPSPLNCEILQSAAQKYGREIRVYQGTVESFGQIDEDAFDLCLFNSSLHHCDAPLEALRICHNKLKKGGQVLAINEPILKFYRSKKWFHEQLENDPVSMGHYGGNEHIYYYQEYIALCQQAGFSSVEGLLHIRNLHPRLVLQEDLQRQIEGKYVLSDGKLAAKFLILLFLKNLWSKPFVLITKKLSLFPYSFRGLK